MAETTIPAAVPKEASPTPPPPVDVNAPQLKSCFICLLNESETPGTQWVQPCPCTLDAHEDCMLRWVTETENSGARSKKSLRCPACNARIRVDEPFDPIVRLRERIHQTFSRASPLVLLDFVLTGVYVGSASYGVMAASVFGGTRAVARWMRFPPELWGYRQNSWVLLRYGWVPFAKFTVLALVGPTLMIHRALPGLGRFFTLPASLAYGAILVARDQTPTWPPSPEWAITAMPCVNLIYTHIYWDFFGTLEKRLNKELRGRLPDETNPEPPEPAANANDAEAVPDEDRGIWGNLWWIGNLVADLFNPDEDVVIEAEIRVVGEDGEEHVIDDEEVEAELHQLELEIAEEEREAREATNEVPVAQQDEPVVVVAARDQGTAETAAAEDEQPAETPQVLPEDRVQNQGGGRIQNENQNLQQNQNQNQRENNREDNGTNTTFMDIINSLATSLLLPGISFCAGELLRVSLPKSWVTMPYLPGRFPGSNRALPTGLLQQRWGRSLVGGCLFVILKDMFILYAKHRKVELRKHRKVRNVKRKRGVGGTGLSSSPAATPAPADVQA